MASNPDTIRIGLIDDHDMVRSALARELESAGHQVVAQSTGVFSDTEELQRFLHESQAQVIILDLSLGAVSGLDLLDRIQKIQGQTADAKRRPWRIVVLTMSTHPWQISKAFELGALGYVLKGSAIVELLDAVRWVCLGRKFYGVGVQELLDSPETQAIKLLSDREHEVLKLTVQGLSSAEIGQRLHLSSKTVDTYRSRVMGKLELKNNAELFSFALKNGYLQI